MLDFTWLTDSIVMIDSWI